MRIALFIVIFHTLIFFYIRFIRTSEPQIEAIVVGVDIKQWPIKEKIKKDKMGK
jgi:hypothetical protein